MTPREYRPVLTPVLNRFNVPERLHADVIGTFTNVGRTKAYEANKTRLWLCDQECIAAVSRDFYRRTFGTTPDIPPARPLDYARILKPTFDRLGIHQRSQVIAFLTEFGQPRPRVNGLEECRSVLAHEMLRASLFPTVRRKLEAA